MNYDADKTFWHWLWPVVMIGTAFMAVFSVMSCAINGGGL